MWWQVQTDLLFACCQQCTDYFLCDVYLYVHTRVEKKIKDDK